MLKVALVMLAILTSIDHVKYYGKYTSAALQASTSVLHHFRLI
jgi:hypothetical protein